MPATDSPWQFLTAFDQPAWVVIVLAIAVALRCWVARPRELTSTTQRVLDVAVGIVALAGLILVWKVGAVALKTRILLTVGIGAAAYELARVLRAWYVRQQRATLLEALDSVLIALLLVFCILRPFVIQAFFIPSGSMENTLLINDRILVSKFTYFLREPRHDEIIVFRAPVQTGEKHKDFIKRVIGLPGDRIAVHDGKLWRNGQPIDEPYIREEPLYEWPEEGGEVTVPPGSLLVMGDNRNCSNDSHRWEQLGADGTIQPAPFLPRENVLGKALVIFWPLTRIRVLH